MNVTILSKSHITIKKGEKMRILYCIFSTVTAILGYSINGNSIFWAVIDFFFSPLAWIKWLICHDVNMTIIRKTFAWFLM